jgi:hypothetical protein
MSECHWELDFAGCAGIGSWHLTKSGLAKPKLWAHHNTKVQAFLFFFPLAIYFFLTDVGIRCDGPKQLHLNPSE